MHLEVCVYGGQRLTWGVFSGGSVFWGRVLCSTGSMPVGLIWLARAPRERLSPRLQRWHFRKADTLPWLLCGCCRAGASPARTLFTELPPLPSVRFGSFWLSAPYLTKGSLCLRGIADGMPSKSELLLRARKASFSSLPLTGWEEASSCSPLSGWFTRWKDIFSLMCFLVQGHIVSDFL